MAMKRLFGDDYEGPSDGSRIPVADNKRRRLRLSFVVSEVMRMKSMEGFLSALEPLLRRVVKEEVDSVLGRFVQGVPRPLNQIHTHRDIRWQLLFRNSLPETLFTGSRIEAEGSEPFQIVIVDADSKMVVTSGPFSMVKIEILVLDGDFGSDGRDDWTEKEFDDSVVREREGKRPLLMGDLTIKLQDGTANVGDLAFTDNSSWRRSRRFRLGAKVVNDNNTKERIQEARSEPFIVKDHRGELYKKHYPPSWEDEVWRLEKIAKDGVFHRKLMRCAIKNVQDFLRFLVVDPTSLRNVLGVGMSNKTWEVACQHAKTCIIDRRCYSYYNLEWQVRLLFNSVYELVGVAFDGQDPQPLSNLTSYQKNLVEKLREAAYKNLNELTETIELPPVDGTLEPLPFTNAASFPASSPETQNANFSYVDQDENAMQDGFRGDMDPYSSTGTSFGPSNAPLHHFTPFETDTLDLGDYFVFASEHQEYDPLDQFQFEHDSDEQSWSSSHPSYSISIPSRWSKLRAAFKWKISVRKNEAARRSAQLLQLGY